MRESIAAGGIAGAPGRLPPWRASSPSRPRGRARRRRQRRSKRASGRGHDPQPVPRRGPRSRRWRERPSRSSPPRTGRSCARSTRPTSRRGDRAWRRRSRPRSRTWSASRRAPGGAPTRPPAAPSRGDGPSYTATTQATTSSSSCSTQLNKNTTKNYKATRSRSTTGEFDFEAPTDYDNNPSTGLLGGEIQGRLTMRDAILVRKGGAVKVKHPQSGHYQQPVHAEHLRDRRPGDAWLGLGRRRPRPRARARRRRRRSSTSSTRTSRRSTTRPSTRASARSRRRSCSTGRRAPKRSIILGDFNSTSRGVKPGDEQAYQTCSTAAFPSARSTSRRLLLQRPVRAHQHARPPGRPRDDQHGQEGQARRLSRPPGTTQTNGIYDSDHAGVFSKLKVRSSRRARDRRAGAQARRPPRR